MKHMKTVSTLLLLTFLLAACTQKQPVTPSPKSSVQQLATGDSFSRFIPMDTANKMILSYLGSIGYPSDDSNLQSLVVDAGQLRKYLDSGDGTAITHVKLMFGHTLEWANTHPNQNAGYKSGDFTLILAGYDGNGNYVFYPGQTVLDYAQPCPPDCPPGNAGNALLTN